MIICVLDKIKQKKDTKKIMSERLPVSPEQAVASPEAVEAAVHTLASEFHEDWRKTRMDESGAFEPRVKTTSDSAWIEAHGTDQVDIANTKYGDLPADWQTENKAAAEVVVNILIERNANIDLSNEDVRNQTGAEVHDAWLSRNDWAKGGELDVPFVQLTPEEQAKDIAQIEIAQRVFSD